MGGGGYLGIRGYRGLAVVDVATIGESDSLLEHGPHMVGYGEVGFELQLHTNSFFRWCMVWYTYILHREIDNNVIWLLVWCTACKRMEM